MIGEGAREQAQLACANNARIQRLHFPGPELNTTKVITCSLRYARGMLWPRGQLLRC